MLTNENGQGASGMSSWGFIIFFLLLFWLMGGGNGFGFGAHNGYAHPGAGYGPFGGFDGLTDVQRHAHQQERDVLNMGTVLSEQTHSISDKLAEMSFKAEAQTAKILEGQKDLYIRDLERAATQMFINGQTSAITQRLDAMEAAGALQRQADNAALSAQIAQIQSSMLKAPAFMPFGGLQTVGCMNWNGCGCGCGTGCGNA